MDLKDMREDYGRGQLTEDDAGDDPMVLFERWLSDAVVAAPGDANAMTLATADNKGVPSARIVLLKEIVDGRFCFFTSYESDKSRDLAKNPQASLLFFWSSLQRQVRLGGTVQKMNKSQSMEYYYARPKESQISALISPQSHVVGDRAQLERSWRDAELKYSDRKVPYPDNWGGWCFTAQKMEFWQGRTHRLHDRLLFTLDLGGHWQRMRLAP